MSGHVITSRGDIVIVLSLDEAEGLLTLAQEGAEGILTDAEATKGYIGNVKKRDAAVAAVDGLVSAMNKRRRWKP